MSMLHTLKKLLLCCPAVMMLSVGSSAYGAWMQDAIGVNELYIGYVDSALDPELQPGYTLVDGSEKSGFQIGFANRQSERWSYYAYVADAGSVEIVDENQLRSEISYQLVAVNAKYHLLPQSGRFNAYAMAGLAWPYASSDDVGVDLDQSLHVDVGAGVGMRLWENFYLTADYEYISQDMQKLGVNLLWRR